MLTLTRFLSLTSLAQNIIQGLACGANDYVTKPYGKLEILARIDTQLQLKKSWKAEMEREKSDALLNKMLPDHVITQLKEKGSEGRNVIANEHPFVCVLFSDVVGECARRPYYGP
jgi:DNA-binding response OmpR family regulator